jgi:DNA-binding NarL/FixJ family response regulator
MSKQRPSARIANADPPAQSAARPERFWRQRVFKNTFTRDGQLQTVKGWSVKIQHQGRRRTFSLRGRNREAAAAEAQAIHQALVAQGWDAALRLHSSPDLPQNTSALVARSETWPKTDARYWRRRLLHRNYPAAPASKTAAPLSARLEHDGISRYFPLNTSDENAAATQAANIYQAIAGAGWTEACRRYPREVTLAFHWAVDPVAWTYSTLHTQMENMASPAQKDRPRPALRVALVEEERGLQQALTYYLAPRATVRAFASGAEALREIPRQRIHFVLVNQVLPDKAGTEFAQALETCAPRVAVVVYSVYEDSSQLFMATPGGASAYLLKRTCAEELLAPIERLLAGGPLSHGQISEHVRQYFHGAALSLQSGEHHHEMGLLTRREKEILDCLSKGQVDKQIADALGISPWTVHGHVKNIFGKLRVHSRTEAVVKYLRK